MAGARKIFRRAAELHQYGRLVDHFACAGADDVDAQHSVSLRIGQDFHEAIGVPHGSCLAIGRERKAPDGISDTRRLQFFLAPPDGGDLWCIV